MHSFRSLDKQIGLIPGEIVVALGEIDTARGREEVYRRQHPQALRTLVDLARIQSTEASNAIEQITAPHRRLRALMGDKTTPQNRSEAEIAGYRSVLDTIHASARDIPFRPPIVEQLHRDLYAFTKVRAGRWKLADNSITEELPDGTNRVRFETTPASDTPAAMTELHERYAEALRGHAHHPLLVIGAYVFDFLAIHPFLDGNGRMSRLLTLLALYQSGYEVGRFISLERLVNDSKETYYEALASSGIGWHEDRHDLRPWLEYFLGILTAAYSEFEQRAGVVGGRGAKRAAIEQFIQSNVSDVFTIAEIRQAAAGASDSYINKILIELKNAGSIERVSAGRSARWRRVSD